METPPTARGAQQMGPPQNALKPVPGLLPGAAGTSPAAGKAQQMRRWTYPESPQESRQAGQGYC